MTIAGMTRDRRDANAITRCYFSPLVSANHQPQDSMNDLNITAAGLSFTARLERELAPRTCAAFEAMLPFTHSMVQARWSGEAAWVPLGNLALDLAAENATSHPLPGHLLLYPGGLSEVELLVPYGKTSFACKDGPLAGNHFITIESGAELLQELGQRVLWRGAQPIVISRS
jgi:hypothetical protein